MSNKKGKNKKINNTKSEFTSLTEKEVLDLAKRKINVENRLKLVNKVYKWPGRSWKINVYNKTTGGEIVDFYIKLVNRVQYSK